MSSATSIDRANVTGVRSAEEHRQKHDRADTFQPWHFFVLASLLAATVAVIMARQSRPEHLVLISLTIGAAGFAGGALYRTLAPLVRRAPDANDGTLSEGLRTVLEREKLLVLRSIKELEFDRAMGKISPKDFEEMAGRLRTRAVSLMRQLDSGSAYRELIERDLSARLRSSSRGMKRTPATREPAADAPAAKPQALDTTCACGTRNDPDAAFCKRCGGRLADRREA
jgi:hypothetical protein